MAEFKLQASQPEASQQKELEDIIIAEEFSQLLALENQLDAIDEPTNAAKSSDVVLDLTQKLKKAEHDNEKLKEERDELKEKLVALEKNDTDPTSAAKNPDLVPNLLLKLEKANRKIKRLEEERDDILKELENQKDDTDSLAITHCVHNDRDTVDGRSKDYVFCRANCGYVNCIANCGMNVFLNIMYNIGYDICTRKFLMHLNDNVEKTREHTIANSCFDFHLDLHEVGLVNKVLLDQSVEGPEHLPRVLEKVMKKMEELGDPGMLLVLYSNSIGHFVKVTPKSHNTNESGFFDLQRNGVWPKCDSCRAKITTITAFTINKMVAPKWMEICGKDVCRKEVDDAIEEKLDAKKKPVPEEG